MSRKPKEPQAQTDEVTVRWLVADRVIPHVGVTEKGNTRTLPRCTALQLIAQGLAVEVKSEE